VNLPDIVVARIEVGCDARAEVDAVADKAFVADLHGFDERFAGVGSGVVNRDGSAVEGAARGVGEFGCVEGDWAACVGIEDQLSRRDLLLEEREHGGFVLADGDGVF